MEVIESMEAEELKQYESAFQEVANIGVGNAVTSLSFMLNQKIDIDVPKVKLIRISKMFEEMEDPDAIYACSYIKVSGDLEAALALMLEKDSAKKLIKDIAFTEVSDLTQLDELLSSVIAEVGNIMAGSYINALSQFLQINLTIEPPQVVVDTFAGILAEAIVLNITYEDFVVATETHINLEKWENPLIGEMVLIMNAENMKKMLDIIRKGFYGQ